jgi:hypothetical protein
MPTTLPGRSASDTPNKLPPVAGPTATAARPATVRATRYALPLREGGSLPALMEADDDGLYVVKFRGAGQGAKALIAELVAGELARRLGLLVPEIAFVEVDPVLGTAEPDPEIQELIEASAGLNLGLDFLPGALTFDAAVDMPLDPALAAAVVWFDALVVNVDRTARNPNLLVWHERLWLIDHGAALHVHHRGWDFADEATSGFPQIADHVLLPHAESILEADERLAGMLDRATLEQLAGLIPEGWLGGEDPERRGAYVEYLERRLAAPREFAQEAERARLGSR